MDSQRSQRRLLHC